MSEEPSTFYSFLKRNDKNEMVKRFNEVFGDEIEKLPDKVTSSKNLSQCFSMDSLYKRSLFNSVFMMYFKEKMRIKN
jgi:hypothetical protein